MKKSLVLIILVVLLFTAGCGPMTPQQQSAWQSAFQGMSQGIQQMNQQKMYDAQYNYYTRPYRVDGILYVPPRR